MIIMKMDINKYEKLEELRSELNSQRLNLLGEDFLSKSNVIEQYGGGYIESRYGYIKGDISDYDLKKVQEIEKLIHEYLMVNTVKELFVDLKSYQGFDEDTQAKVKDIDEELHSNFSHLENENVENFLEDIEKLIEPLKQKQVYIPRAKTTSYLLSKIFMTLAINGMYDAMDYYADTMI